MGGHEENYGTRTLKYEIAKSLRLFDLGISTGLVDSRIATLKSHPSHVKEIGFESDNLRVIGQPPIKAALELVETTTLSKEEFFARGSWFWNQHDEKYYYDQMRQVFTNFNNQINSNRSLEEIAEEFDLDHVKKYLTYISKFQSFNIVDLDFALIETGTQKEFDVVSYIASGFPNQVGLDTTHLVDSGSLDEMRTLARDYPHAQIYLFPKCVDQKMLEVIPGFLAWSYVPLLGIRSFVIPNDTYNPKPSTAADLENILEICSVQGVRSHKVIPKEEIGVVVTPMPRISGLEDDEKVDLLYAFKMHFGSELVGNSTFETVTSDTSSGFVGRYGKVIYKSGQIDQLITERDVIQVLEKDDFLQSRIANLVKISTIASGIANAVGQPFLFTKLNHSFVQRLDYKPHNMETKFVEKLRQVFGFNDCYEDPLMQRIFTLAYLHGELNPQIFPDTLPTTYHDFSTSEIREDHKYLGRRVIQMCQ
ncbi:hypothetical protein HN953_00300, partial [Candidatus Woesearchaeota archaeon]|nr:hypothetical protein [Candidatus Woesearchaeota archaeon]